MCFMFLNTYKKFQKDRSNIVTFVAALMHLCHIATWCHNVAMLDAM